MLSFNKSFLCGICFASITWILSLYLYIELNKAPVNSPLVTFPFESSIPSKEQLATNLDLSDLGIIRSKQDKKVREDGYNIHAFNTLISNRLGHHRNIPDTRNALCDNITYPTSLPAASIIICFYNEHLNTLLRTIYSILDRTPSQFLEEILLIDDYSDIEDLQMNLKLYIDAHLSNKVKLHRTHKREGLIRARIYGSRLAKGEVLLFLDSHIEVNKRWIEPLLARIEENKKNVAMPVIDIINADTFVYSPSPLVRGGFTWGLHFKWDNLPKGTLVKKEDFVKPIKSPTMAGGLFAMNREYFKELGEYDAYMNIWGGENVEISFRIWMCGGHLDLIPCSRVGHVFRQRRPYGDPNGEDTMLYNSLRVAHVWMDDYKKFFLQDRKGAETMNYGDISSRATLRKELSCKDFEWYLKNVYPELTLPTDNKERLKKKWASVQQDKYQPWYARKRNYVAQYQIKLSGTELCIQSEKNTPKKGVPLILKDCTKNKSQLWYETDKHELVLSKLLCLQSGKTRATLGKCHETGGDQEWKHKGEDGIPLFNMAAGTCLGVKKPEENVPVLMKICNEGRWNKWDIVFSE
ncbi:hypothetical protein WA026_022090 [Henosepilachna vigintioctopunctata]|uniref:Polypeptide N-acetylgalactosaminyltransferase n=1 Tax=Henosepilachna vigintioctopunctata TaxID=420089 RepID=A0AAW1UED7_9CUCU